MAWATVVRSIVERTRDGKVTLLAGSIAYSAFVSAVPIVLLSLVALSVLGDATLARRVVTQAGGYLSTSGQDLATAALSGTTGRTGASIASVAALAWTATKVFRALEESFALIYGTPRDVSLLEQVRDGILVIALMALAAALMLAIGVIVALWDVVGLPAAADLPVPPGLPVRALVGAAVLLVGLTVLFLPVYALMPPVRVSVVEALPGTVFAVIGWLLLQWGVQFYAGNAATYRLYGVLGGVLLVLTWLYFAGAILLLGAVVNAVLGEQNALPGEGHEPSTGPEYGD